MLLTYAALTYLYDSRLNGVIILKVLYWILSNIAISNGIVARPLYSILDGITHEVRADTLP